LAAAIVLWSLFMLGSCRADRGSDLTLPDSETTTFPASETSSDITEEAGKSADISLYTVVYGSGAGEATREFASNLRGALEEKTGKKIKIKDDWVMPHESPDNDDYEILVGKTNRSESKKLAAGVRYNDFIITISGNKIVIFAHTEALLAEATAYFRIKLTEESGIYYWSGCFIKNGQYPLEGMSMLNVSAKNYKIVISDSPAAVENFAAETIRKTIAAKCGHLLDIVRESEAAGESLIAIGIGGGVDPDTYSLSASGGEIEITAGGAAGLIALVERFVELLDGAKTAALDKSLLDFSGRVSEGPAKRCEGAELRIMTSNVLFSDSPSFETPYRMSCLMHTYLTYLPDVIGLQEARNTQLAALMPYLEADYAAVPFAAEDGGQVYQQILYLKKKYTPVDYGFTRFRYRVIPWGVSWAVFERKSDGKLFAVTNTHNTVVAPTYDPGLSNSIEGVQYRISNCRTVLQTIDYIRQKYPGIPVFSTGDWNSEVSEESLDPMNDSKLMENAMQKATVSANTKTNSGHGLGLYPGANGHIIDHIFFSADVAEVLYHDVVVNNTVINGSDHCPVFADIKFLK